MLRAIRFELIKLLSSKKFYVIAAVIVGMCFFMGVGVAVLNNMEGGVDKITINGQSYPLFFLEQLADILPILLVILLGGIIADEYRDGTLKLTLLRPVIRSEVLCAKAFIMLFSLGAYLATAIAASYVTGTIIFGWGENFIVPQTDIIMSTADGILKTILAYGITAVPLTAFIAIVLLLSINITNSGMVLGVGIGIYFILKVLLFIELLRPFIINNYMLLGKALFLPELTINWIYAFAVMLTYIAGFGIASFKTFNKKDIVY